MRVLMRKDLRLLAPVLIGMAVLAVFLLGVLPVGVAMHYRDDAQREMLLGRSAFGGLWADQAYKGCVMLTLFTLMALAVIGGMAFAQERREKWADFAAMLPVPRRRAVFAKLLTSAAVCVGLYAVVLLLRLLTARLAGGADGWVNYASARSGDGAALTAVLAGTAVALFGVSWLGSALLPNPVWATVASVAVVGGTAFWRVSGLITGADPWYFVRSATWHTAAGAVVLGVLATVAGAVAQTWRVSP